jgi:DNA invertase Pin-like site-specific DNA recombinase
MATLIISALIFQSICLAIAVAGWSVQFAELLADCEGSNAAVNAIALLASRLACIFKDDNPAFDRQRFLRACGVNGAKSLADFFTEFLNEMETKMIVGYARVSTDGQTLDAQQSALRQAGAEKIFAEKVSGAVTDRKALAKAIAALSQGDVLLVTRLDRLARSTRDLLNVLAAIAEKGAGFRSIADPMIDTTSAHGRSILAVLGALAEFERSMILSRTPEGRKRAMANGVRFGRKRSLTPRCGRLRHHVAAGLARRGIAHDCEHVVERL